MKIRQYKDENGVHVTRQTFDSYSAMLRDLETLPDAHGAAGAGLRDRRDEESTAWAGGTFGQALRLARCGWPEGAQRFRAGMALPSMQSAQALLPVRGRAVVGSSVCVPAFVAGRPNHMRGRVSTIPAAHPVVRFLVHGFVSGGVDAACFENRGIALASIVNQLEDDGRRCEVVVSISGSNYGEKARIDTIVEVKRAEEQLNVDRLAYCLAHVSTFRRIGFRAWDCAPVWEAGPYQTISSSYSAPDQNPTIEPDQIFLPCLRLGDDSYDTPEKARATIERLVAGHMAQ